MKSLGILSVADVADVANEWSGERPGAEWSPHQYKYALDRQPA